MGIEKIKTAVVSFVQGVAKKGEGKLAKADAVSPEAITKVSKKNQLANSLEGLSNNAKAAIAIKKEKIAQKTSQDTKMFQQGQKLRKEALIADSKMFGLNKVEAENAADALMKATGEFSHKDAMKSAELLKDVPLPQGVLKQDLLLKKAQRDTNKVVEKLS